MTSFRILAVKVRTLSVHDHCGQVAGPAMVRAMVQPSALPQAWAKV
jgi:hypothetical protein